MTTLPYLQAQIDLPYQKPSKEILDLVDAPMPPLVTMNSNGTKAVLLYREVFKSIEELAEPEMRLGGLRINPITNISSRQQYYYNLKTLDIQSGEEIQVKGLPEKGRYSNFTWSPNEKLFGFTNTTSKGVELWILDIASHTARRLTDANLNANMGSPYTWFRDNQNVLAKFLPKDIKPLLKEDEVVPAGPTISESDGKEAQNRTYQDLLKDKNDEFNFEQLTRADLVKVGMDGSHSPWLQTAMYYDLEFSPDGNFVLVTTIQKPFSYLVPFYRFPYHIELYTLDGKFHSSIEKVPLTEDLPKGFMATRTGRRSISWRADRAATLYWAEALDGGDPQTEADFRDVVYELEAPFSGKPQMLLKTQNRYSGITWGTDQIALASDQWWSNRNTKTYQFNPSDPNSAPIVLFDRNYQDRYNDPGEFVTQKNEWGRSVLVVENEEVFLIGDGYSEEGIRPFVDKMNLRTQQTVRLYQAEGKNSLENIRSALDMKKGMLLTRIESKNDYPNYYIRNIFNNTLTPVTNFPNPFEALQNVHKEIILYKRDDGVELSATLYLPPGYDLEKKEKLPMLMWAYPKEFKDKSSAAQVTSSPNEFTYPYYGSPLYWLMKGYVVLDDAAFPIIGEGEEEPNDSFIKQLVANAKAAIDEVDNRGLIDRRKVAVGGHSYGAFMTANLLSHSNLFAAGIARSGAYNRTLTPFGFQSEERSYWEAPDIYYQMSPFMHADKMKTPLLLIHGEADNNSGTYPMQSERYFNALKGLGAPARLVILPKESHGYAARESILHMLWEQDQWLEKHVKNRQQDSDAGKP